MVGGSGRVPIRPRSVFTLRPLVYPMPQIQLDDRRFDTAPGETILDTLLRHGVDHPHGCRQGLCQSCLITQTAGPIPDGAQIGLKPGQIAQNLVLACLCHPENDLSLTRAGTPAFQPATITDIRPLSAGVVQILLTPSETVSALPGQFINLRRPDGLIRSYSLANLTDVPGPLELHIQQPHPSAPPEARSGMAPWLAAAKAGQAVAIQGPVGQCVYLGEPDRLDQPILLIGTGTGLAPLLAILRAALLCGHRGPIRLYHGASSPGNLYLIDHLTGLAARHPNLTVEHVLSVPDAGFKTGNVGAVALAETGSLAGWRVYLCGHPLMVKSTRKAAFLAGAALKDIEADAFVSAPAH